MKKLTAILLFMSIMLSIIGCGAETVNGTASAEKNSRSRSCMIMLLREAYAIPCERCNE